MIAYNISLGRTVKLGQVAYAQPYPPSGIEWGQGWSRFYPNSTKVVLPRSPEGGGGVGYTSEGTVLSQQDIEEISAASGQPEGSAPSTAPVVPVAPAPAGAPAAAPSEATGKFPLAAAGVAVAAIAASFII